jgi:lysophospholipase L1-like esterase
MIGATTMGAIPLYSRNERSNEKSRFVALFQGDSITDGNRGRSDDPNHILGHGYAFSIASMLGSSYPERKLSFINRGNSGDTLAAINARWRTDALDLTPNLISLLAGINDVQQRINSGRLDEPSTSARDLKELLETTKQVLPNARVVLGEPFILPVGMVNKNRDAWESEMKKLRADVESLASEYNCILVRYQFLFNQALKHAPADYWIWDGIHPTYNGHGLMAKEWLRQVSKTIPQLKIDV